MALKGVVFGVGARKQKHERNTAEVEEEVDGWEKGRNVSGWRRN